MKVALWVLAILAAIAAFVVFMAKSHPGSEEVDQARAADRRAIESCRKAQNDELQNLSTRRGIRTMCDRMAEEFKVKYGEESE